MIFNLNNIKITFKRLRYKILSLLNMSTLIMTVDSDTESKPVGKPKIETKGKKGKEKQK